MITSINVYASEDKLIYKIGYEVGFQDGASNVYKCVKSNDTKEQIETCIQSLIQKTNNVKSTLPDTERLILK